MDARAQEALEKLLQAKKYRDICPDTIRRVWSECLPRHKRVRDAEKAAREALHGISGAFMTPGEAAALRADMAAWDAGGRTDFGLEQVLARHASTRERLPIARMDTLYARIFEVAARPDHVLDLACGVNPLYLGARVVNTTGVDISGLAVACVNDCGAACGLPVRAVCADLLCPGGIPDGRFDVALLFKILPLLERQRTGSAMAVLSAIRARHIVVSFPTRTLGGRDVGMSEHYARWFEDRLPEGRAIAARFELENELFYILY